MATATLDQIGFETAGGSFDTTNPLVLPADGSRLGGVRFTGLPTQLSGAHEQTDRLYDGFTLTFGDASGSPDGTLTVYLVEETDPAAFSGSRLPGSLTETQVGTITVTSTTIGSLAPALGTVTQRYRRVGWKGTLAFTFAWSSSGADLTISRANATNTSLTGSDRNLESGLVGRRWLGSRILRDHKTGEQIREDEAVLDPLTRGLVASENADPPEERMRHAIRRVQPRRR